MKCVHCGKDNVDGIEYCFYCGTPLTDDLNDDKTSSRKASSGSLTKKKPVKILIFAVSFVLIFCAIGGVWYFFAHYSINPKNNDSEPKPSLVEDSKVSLNEDDSSFDDFEMNYDDIDETVIVSDKEEFLTVKDHLDDMVNKQLIAVNCFFTEKDGEYQITYDRQSYLSVICPKRVQVSNILDRTSDFVFFVTKQNGKTAIVLMFERGYDELLSNYSEAIDFYNRDIVEKTAKVTGAAVRYIPDNQSYWIHLPDAEWDIGIISTRLNLNDYEGKTIDFKCVNVDNLPAEITPVEATTYWYVYSIDKIY